MSIRFLLSVIRYWISANSWNILTSVNIQITKIAKITITKIIANVFDSIYYINMLLKKYNKYKPE